MSPSVPIVCALVLNRCSQGFTTIGAHKALLISMVLRFEPSVIEQACWTEFGDLIIYFNEPVKTAVVPDYYKVIKQPRDLGSIKKKLQRKQFESPQQFKDVRPDLLAARAYFLKLMPAVRQLVAGYIFACWNNSGPICD